MLGMPELALLQPNAVGAPVMGGVVRHRVHQIASSQTQGQCGRPPSVPEQQSGEKYERCNQHG